MLTGRLQSDPLKKRFSRFVIGRMSGGRFLVSTPAMQEVIRKNHLIKLTGYYFVLLQCPIRNIDCIFKESTVRTLDMF